MEEQNGGTERSTVVLDDMIKHHRVPYSTLVYHIVLYTTIKYYSFPYNTILYDFLAKICIKCNTVLHSTIKYNTILKGARSEITDISLMPLILM